MTLTDITLLLIITVVRVLAHPIVVSIVVILMLILVASAISNAISKRRHKELQ